MLGEAVRRAVTIADFILKCVSIIAIIVGGIWAWWRFDIFRADVDNVSVEVAAETAPYDQHQSLVIIHVKPHNLGRVLSSPKAF